MGIKIQNVRKTYRGPDGGIVVALRVDSLAVEDGEEVCIVGGSGSGKTTLLNIIAGITPPDAGSVTVDAVEITKLGEAARDKFRARRLGYVFQTFNLLQAFTALENVLLPLKFAGTGASEARARARELLERVGLGSKSDRKPASLSVGEQQRVAVARAVACKPTVILADEPTANLDGKNAEEAMRLLREIASENAAILIVVTHDPRLKAEFKRAETLGVVA
jgi:putative ABC transport system ATP-binding protein